MSEKTMLQNVSEETMRFMRGKYSLDEVGNGKDSLRFCQGNRTILTILIREDHYDFRIILGKGECEKFEAMRETFSKQVVTIFDHGKTYRKGKCLVIPVANLAMLEEVKKLIMLKLKPNRKPFPKEQAVVGECGHRCDLCVHYTGGTISESFRLELKERLIRVYQSDEWWGEDMMLCPGCSNNNPDQPCEPKKCAVVKGAKKCMLCHEYPCEKALAGLVSTIQPQSISAVDVTWAILPYVYNQYGN